MARSSNWNRGSFWRFSPLGFSLPDLTITGQAGPRAAWGGTLVVSAILQNIGASTITEPLSQLPTTQARTPGSPYGSTSTADVTGHDGGVLMSEEREVGEGRGQDWNDRGSADFAEQRGTARRLVHACRRVPRDFREAAARSIVWFVADSSNNVLEVTKANNISKPVAVRVTSQPLPELRAVALALAVETVAGRHGRPDDPDRELGHGQSRTCKGRSRSTWWRRSRRASRWGARSSRRTRSTRIPGSFSSTDLGQLQDVWQRLIINEPQNVVTISGAAVTLPVSPAKYFVGVVIDPNGTINQLSLPTNNFEQIRVVGPKTKFLPPAGVVSSANTGQFPNPPSGQLIGVH